MNAITDHMNAITGHMNAIAGHVNAIAGHVNVIAGHMNAIAGHMNAIGAIATAGPSSRKLPIRPRSPKLPLFAGDDNKLSRTLVNLIVESTPGVGSTFSFTIPLRKSP